MKVKLSESWCETHAPAYKNLLIDIEAPTNCVPYSCTISGERKDGREFLLCMDREGIKRLVSEVVIAL